MAASKVIRAAATQFHIGADVDINLATCLAMLDKAGRDTPDVIVLPEFCNHLSWYDDQDHCRRVSVHAGGQFLAAIAQKAAQLATHVVVNVTLNRSDTITTATSLLFGPKGQLLGENDKQVLIGHENDFLVKATHVGPVIDTALGQTALYACMDGVINETPRGLALRGADVLLNSLNSFATDEASLHIPVRAAENKVFVVASNKVGPLVPENMVDAIAAATGIPARFLNGAGESQIVAPDGTILARAPVTGDTCVFAEFDPSRARDKSRPDGTDIFAARRPDLYGPIAKDPSTQRLPAFTGPREVQAALVHGQSRDDLLKATREAYARGARLVGLAPMAGVDPREFSGLIPDGCFLGGVDSSGDAWLVSHAGVVMHQPCMHSTRRFGLARANEVLSLETPIGRIALVAGDDGLFPEYFRLLAMTGAEIAIAPVTPLETWELRTGLLERAAENRVNLLAPAAGKERGFAASLQRDFTIMTPWETRAFDGLLSHPVLTRAHGDVTLVTLYPNCAANKVVSRNTDVLAGRPWRLAQALVSQ